MSVRLLRSDLGFAFAFRCDGGCKRPDIVALTLPVGWEPLRTAQGELLHRCPGCRFDLIVEPLIRDLGWRRAA
jgi:hypothetical protein